MREDRSARSALSSIALSLPGVKDATTRRGWSFKVRGQLLACEALHSSAEPDSAVVKISLDERARLIAAQPEAYYLTDHYRPYPSVLVRLRKVDRDSLRSVLEMAHRFVAGKIEDRVGKRPPATPRRRG